MADFFKGLAGGMQTGLQFGRAMQERQERERQMQMRDALAQEAGRYGVTEGAYGPGLQENIQQLQGLREQDPAQAAAYDQAIGELTRRQGMTAPDYSVASGPTNFATRQEARQAAAPLRAEGLAGVYRQYGDVAQADALEARAFDQQRAIAREGRDVAAEADRVSRRPLELEDLQTRTAAGKLGLISTQQQIDTGALTLEQQKRAATAAKNMDNFNLAVGEANAIAQAEGRVLSPRDISDLAKANKLSFTQENELIAAQVNRSKAEVEQFRLDVEKVTQGKSHDELIDLHKNDKRFGDGMHFVPEFDKKTGKHILARVNEATGRVEERLPFKSKAEATAYLREEAVNPANAAVWLQNYQKGAAAIEAQGAATEASRSTVGLNAAKTAQTNAQTKILNANVANNEEARKIQGQLANLTDENDPTGTNRARLIDQFNMLAVGPGKTIPAAGGGGKKGSVLQTPVDLKKNDDGTYTAFAKDGGQALYNTFNGETIPLGMEVDTYRGMKEAAKKNGVGLVAGEDNGRLVVKFTGVDGKFYDDAEKAKYAKPAKSTAQPGGLDTSRTTVVQPAAEPTAPTPKPEKRPGEKQTDFRDRLLAWDKNRMAYERLMTEQRLRGQLSGNAAGLRRPLVE